MLQSLISLITRDLSKLKDEILQYPNEESLWVVTGNISNSAGNLCLHLLGNLNHFVGAVLGKSGYVRNRDAEFASKNVPREKLVLEIDRLTDVVKTTLSNLKDDDLKALFPIEVFKGRKESTANMLVHFHGHLNYHLGQINYHRRLTAI